MLQNLLFIIFVFIVNLTTNNQAVFTARRNVRIASAVLAIAIPSVCPSVGPIANLKGHYFQPSLSVCLSVCVSLTGASTLQR